MSPACRIARFGIALLIKDLMNLDKVVHDQCNFRVIAERSCSICVEMGC